MENLKIKTEDIARNSLSCVKKEEIENIYVDDDVKNLKVLEVKAVKKEESEHEWMDKPFETILLPEFHESIAVETPFFEFNKYKKKLKERYDIPVEDGETSKGNFIMVYSSMGNSENNVYKNLKTDQYRSIKSENLNSDNYDYSSSHFEEGVYRDNCDKIWYNNENYQNSTVHFNLFQREPTLECTRIHCDRNSETNVCNGNVFINNKILYQNKQKRKQIKHINKSKYKHQNKNKHMQITSHVTYVANDIENYGLAVGCLNDNRRKNGKSVKGKYQCPICKRVRVFDTFIALNNHLNFEHISVFNIREGMLVENTLLENKTGDDVIL